MGKSKRSYPWMPYAKSKRYLKEASRLGVSKVARSARGFMTQYARARSALAMKHRPVRNTPNVKHQTWGARRHAFISRHLPQYRKNPTKRRRLALIMWAYDPG